MYFQPQATSTAKQLIAGFATLLFLLFLMSGGKETVLSGWRGDETAAGLSGTASEVGQVGQGDTLIAPPGTPDDEPWGNPIIAGRVVMTQGYDVGTHAPAATWGAIDMAVDGDGDGQADIDASFGVPVRATMGGIVKVDYDSYPAGNHVWVIGDRFKTGYAHLDQILVQDGQIVQRGDIIGTVGSTGLSSGPHLHYHIWLDGVNVNPLGYHPLP
jgi:murein DD-endopeptidase MepM/ murein hydrolase activator NlpD